MDYFYLKTSLDSSVIGTVYPQVECSNPFERSPTFELARKEWPPSIILPEYKIRYRAKVTDIMTTGEGGVPTQMLISAKFFELLNRFSIPHTQILPTKVFDKKGEALNYYIFRQLHPMDSHVDYTQSIFTGNRYDFSVNPPQYIDKEGVVFSGFDELTAFMGSTKMNIAPSKFFLNENAIAHDAFYLSIPFVWVINQYVKELLEKQNITGIDIKPYEPGESFCEDNTDPAV